MRVLPAAPQAHFGSYEVVGALGQGGMAEVWQATQRLPTGRRRPVALKRMRAHLLDDPSALRMFREEARLSARLRHANIVGVVDTGELDGQPFIAFELIDGIELRRLLRERKEPLPFGFTVFLVRQLCAALSYAHRLTDENGNWLRIVHRDISPSNVMISCEGTIKLLDFGVARARRDDGSETTLGVAKGKIGYMAPEVAAGEPFDERSDLFSLGVVLYEMLTQRRLFCDKDERVALLLNRTARATPPSQANAEVPPVLDEVTLRALKRDAAARFQAAEEMDEALARAQEALPWTAEDTRALVADHLPRTVELMPEPYTDDVEATAAPPSLSDSATLRRSQADRPVTALPAATVRVPMSEAPTRAARLQSRPSRRSWARASRAVLLGGVLCAATIIAVVRWERATAGRVAAPSATPSASPVVAPSAVAVAPPSASAVAPPSASPVVIPSPVATPLATATPAPARPAPARPHGHAHSSSRAHTPAPPLQRDKLFNPFGAMPRSP